MLGLYDKHTLQWSKRFTSASENALSMKHIQRNILNKVCYVKDVDVHSICKLTMSEKCASRQTDRKPQRLCIAYLFHRKSLKTSLLPLLKVMHQTKVKMYIYISLAKKLREKYFQCHAQWIVGLFMSSCFMHEHIKGII